MTGLLLDTHVLVWFESGDPKLSRAARAAIEEGDASHVSLASVLEMALALAKGRWPAVAAFFPDAANRLRSKGYEVVAIEGSHIERSVLLPPHHADPFDRLLVATAQAEGLTLVSADAALRAYDVAILD